MKTLILIRHGKSTWDLPSINDMDRPLTERGIHDGYTMALKLAEIKKIPQLIISSPAIRALHTAVIFARALKLPSELLQIDEVLYFGEPSGIIDFVKTTPDSFQSLAIVGHNPIITLVANSLINNPIDDMSTTSIVSIKFNTESWVELCKELVIEELFNYPKKK